MKGVDAFCDLIWGYDQTETQQLAMFFYQESNFIESSLNRFRTMLFGYHKERDDFWPVLAMKISNRWIKSLLIETAAIQNISIQDSILIFFMRFSSAYFASFINKRTYVC
jgi:hypothetical protein